MGKDSNRGLENINAPKEYIKNKNYLNPPEAERRAGEYYSLTGTPKPAAERSRILKETSPF